MFSFIQEPDKPGDAVNYLKNTLGGTTEDKTTIEKLRTENTDLKAKVKSVIELFSSSPIFFHFQLAELESSQTSLNSQISSLESKVATSATPPPSSPAPEEAKASPQPEAASEPAPAVEASEAVDPEPSPAAEAAADPVTEAAPAGDSHLALINLFHNCLLRI